MKFHTRTTAYPIAVSWFLLLQLLALPAFGFARVLSDPGAECSKRCCRSKKSCCCRRTVPAGPSVSARNCPSDCALSPLAPHPSWSVSGAPNAFHYDLLPSGPAALSAELRRTPTLFWFALRQRPPPGV